MLPADVNGSFSRQYRIKSSLQIQEIVEGRQSVFAHPIKCYYRIADRGSSAESTLAVVVPKRRFHRAVDRNRLKRLMREAYRTHKFHFSDSISSDKSLQMCWIYVGDRLSDYESLCQAVLQVQQKLQKAL
ncbi:MAG: ribonuclease P protein component [Bacteroidales bacterium]|nr:ribonuclease P protein component [Bacteroidales bacterium]